MQVLCMKLFITAFFIILSERLLSYLIIYLYSSNICGGL